MQFFVDLFESKASGIMDLLDEEMKFPTASDVHFTNEVHSKNNKHFRLAVSDGVVCFEILRNRA